MQLTRTGTVEGGQEGLSPPLRAERMGVPPNRAASLRRRTGLDGEVDSLGLDSRVGGQCRTAGVGFHRVAGFAILDLGARELS